MVLTTMACMRAMEAQRPPAERIFDDPFSRRLLPGAWKALLFPGLRHLVQASVERRGPGSMGNLYCRTRYIDDALQAALETGLDQVLILGAGFDSRAYQIAGIDGARVYEVDQPAASRLKQARVRQALGTLPPHVTYVPADLDREKLDDVLLAAGFETGVRTFVVWEGVTQYITAEAVDATLRTLARLLAPGSQVAFTYIPLGIVDGSARSEIDEQFVAIARDNDMPWITGFDTAEMPAYLEARGLTLVEEVWRPYYRQHYLAPLGRNIAVFGERLALACFDGAREE
jgi:methyltransferase (TIGR00027 family)